MDSFELNKIVAAILMVALLIIGLGKISGVIFYVEKPKTPGYAVDVAQVVTSSSSSTEVVEQKVDISALMAMGDITHGKKVFKKCAACHSIVVGRKIGGLSNYKYSKALAAYGKEWTFEELNGFLIKPAKWIKGTKMAYAGLIKEKNRASVIKYLNENSDNPLPLP